MKNLVKIVQQCRAPYEEAYACSYYRKVQNILYVTTFKPVEFDIWLKNIEGTHNCFLWSKLCYFISLSVTCSSQTH